MVRSFDIGVVYDDDDDDVRLALVTKHGAGTKNVTAFVNDGGTPLTSTKPNTVTIDLDGHGVKTIDGPVSVREASGTFIMAEGLAYDQNILSATKPTTIYQYEDGNGVQQYVRFVSSEEDNAGVTTYTYQGVNTRKGAKIPEAAGYQHIHFGVWAALDAADKDSGEQDIAELGIAFVQNYMGGMTEEMPNNGTGEYSGNWVANVQEMDGDEDGDISLDNGRANMMANFGKDTVEVTLTGLASLEGAISGNTFSGEKATVDDEHATLDPTADFEGTLNGAFFGSKAAEAGGVFDFASDDGKGGAFRGAFGSSRTGTCQRL